MTTQKYLRAPDHVTAAERAHIDPTTGLHEDVVACLPSAAEMYVQQFGGDLDEVRAWFELVQAERARYA